ncbi:MAG: redoxin domain-containing protein [Deltaproteobacteria bacterium]|nr:redoxin domain-containing protein [Deltaproteobacteria bacterium]
MSYHTLLLLLVATLITALPVQAQLGPKDGARLPATDLERVKFGQLAPDFTLEDATGNRVSLSDFRGKKKILLVFYRGHW